MGTHKLFCGNSLEVLKQIPSESVDCCVTSPPYFALRDYGIQGQIGAERTFAEYIKNLCDIFDEIKRVLKKTGTCFVNLGDTYFGGCGGPQSWERENRDIEWHEQSLRNPHALAVGSFTNFVDKINDRVTKHDSWITVLGILVGAAVVLGAIAVLM